MEAYKEANVWNGFDLYPLSANGLGGAPSVDDSTTHGQHYGVDGRRIQESKSGIHI